MKFRIIFDNGANEITVITENGGIACIREVEDMSTDKPRIAVTDYYQMRLTDVPLDQRDNLFDHLATGKMYNNDWVSVKYNSLTAIGDALDWLCVGETDWELSEDLFLHFFGIEQVSKTNIIPNDYSHKIANADVFELLNMLLETPSLLQNSYLANLIKSRNKN